MRRTIGIVAVLALIAVLGGAALIYTGFFSVAATERHSGVVQVILEAARVRSIKAHAAGIAAPVGLDNQARIVPGTAHFAEHCATCHSAPGVQAGDMAENVPKTARADRSGQALFAWRAVLDPEERHQDVRHAVLG